MKILMVHGWAFGPWIWDEMADRLKDLLEGEEVQFTQLDFGFFGKPTPLPKGHFDLAIGHSFGLLWLLQTPLVAFDRLIAVNGFTRFSADTDFQCGWPHRIVQRMRKQLAVETDLVIGNFMEKSGNTQDFQNYSDSSAADIVQLDWALEALINFDGREQWEQFTGPCRAIAGTQDPIVTPEHTQQCFADSDIQWLKSPSHCLPIQFPEICAALVRELIEVS